MNVEKKNTPNVYSSCSDALYFTKNEVQFSTVSLCEIGIQGVCYDYVDKLHFNTE